ncbi:MAG TPA: alpha/beta hydrolase [Candidatus Binataceae bacterium]|nr:alpha/beta hydrolase [Candidatus Binataceae bacterium]HVA68825.1 alpha/beta hydrolase [Candidatus Binataceae bacterium]
MPNAEAAITHHYANLPGVRIHYAACGKGAPLILIHGWPQTWYEWRRVMPILADRFAMVAPDMRGLGDSSRPSSGYDKKTVANDLWLLMHDHLGHQKFDVVGHDWGAPVAFRLAADHPEAVTHLVLLDTPIPGDQPSSAGFGGPPRWHHQFHNVPDLPEALTVGRERIYLEFLYMNGIDQAGAFSDADIAEYVRTYAQPGAMRAGFDFYRAIRQDADDNRATLATGFRLPMPALGLGGGGSRGRGDLVLESLRRVALHAEGGSVPDCGHFIPEEKPEELAIRLRNFLSK